MPGKRMTRCGETEALRRVENAARTTGDFKELTDLYDKFDGNRERRECDHEVGNFESMYLIVIQNEGSDYPIKISYKDGAVIPPPLIHPYWKELMRGDFHSTIYDNADEIWQIIGDWQVGRLVKNLTAKQCDVLFRSVVRRCSSEQIAECTDKTERGYAEPYDWLHNQFRDWASMFFSAILYYEEKDATMHELHRRTLSAYSGVAPHYRIIMNDDAPTLK